MDIQGPLTGKKELGQNPFDLTTSTTLGMSTIFEYSTTEPVTFPEPSLFMLVLGREGSSWNEMGM